MRRLLLTSFAVGLAACASVPDARADGPCKAVAFDEAPFTICTLPLEAYELRLHHRTADGALIGQPAWLEELLAKSGETLVLATNAGMYHPDRSPVGLYVEAGETYKRLVRGEGPGNFQLLPNGVFWMDGERAGVSETEAYHAAGLEPDFATQSGPMLVIDGALHPAFREASDSLYRRNGVGISEAGDVVYVAISEVPVNFHHFARLFRDEIGVDQALYLDGKVSRLDVPGEGRREFGLAMGPILAVVARGSGSD